MANDKQIESHHSKRHRSDSSSDEAEKSGKRHKHRHHKHHHRRHKRHHRDKKRDDGITSGGDEVDVKDVDTVGVSNGGADDVEEGEILDEEGIVKVLTKISDSDGESGETKSDLPVDGVSGSLRESVLQGEAKTSNGVHESEREDNKRWYKESGDPSDKVGKRSYDNGRNSFPSENSEEKHKTSKRSPTHSIRARSRSRSRAPSRSRSRDRKRELSKSRNVAADEFSVRGRKRDSSRDYREDRVDSRSTEEKYYRRGRYEEDDRHYSREVLESRRSKERDMDREGSIRDRDSEGCERRERDSDRRRERERERRREIEADRGRRKDKERERSVDRDRRRDRERDYLRDRDNERGRSIDRTRYNSRERKIEKERESDRGTEIQADKEKYKSLDMENGKRSRKEDDQNDNDEGVIWEFQEEDEELNRVKESRKRMEAILEKYKKPEQGEQQNELFSQDKGKGNSSSFIAITLHNEFM